MVPSMYRFAGRKSKIVVATVLFAASAAAARNNAAERANLELRLKPGKLLNGIPGRFSFELVNVSDHDLRVPDPKVDCNSALDGSVWLQLDFTPAKFNDTGSGFGCVED